MTHPARAPPGSGRGSPRTRSCSPSASRCLHPLRPLPLPRPRRRLPGRFESYSTRRRRQDTARVKPRDASSSGTSDGGPGPRGLRGHAPRLARGPRSRSDPTEGPEEQRGSWQPARRSLAERARPTDWSLLGLLALLVLPLPHTREAFCF